MKKLLLLVSFILFTSVSAYAETIIGTALSDFSTEQPTQHFTVKLNEGFTVDNIFSYQEGTILSGSVVKVVNGKIGKRKGYFVFIPSYYSNSDGVHKISSRNIEVKVSYYKPFDKEKALKNLANSGLTTAASKIFHVPMLSQGISFIKGAIHPEEDTNRIVSGVKNVYKSSPLTYVEKGEELYVHPGQEVKLHINEE